MSVFTQEASAFLQEHTVGTLSTVDGQGNAHGAVVYYVAEEGMNIYFVSKTGTSKVQNIASHPQVSFTVFDAPNAQTLQINGTARTETDQSTIEYVFDTVVKKRPYNGAMLLPPVTALQNSGEFTVIRITPTEAKYSDYRQELEQQSHA